MGAWHAYTDGSYNHRYPDVIGIGVLLLDDGGNERLTYSKYYVNRVSLCKLHNIGAEIAAGYMAIHFAQQLGCKKLVIFHDYEGLSRLANEVWDPHTKGTIQFRDEIRKFKDSGMELIFKQVEAHSGNKGNDVADFLATLAIDNYVRDLSFKEIA